jgi:hypothetical protein
MKTLRPAMCPAMCPALHPRLRRALFAVLAVPTLLAGGGCAIEPWVKPYERERLADPLMQFSRATLTERHREHVHAVREGARGAVGVQGGGCGCN